MRIGVNTRLLLEQHLEGIGWFTFENLKRITNTHPEHEFVFFYDRKHSKYFEFAPNITHVELFPPARHPFLWFWFFEWSLARALKKYKIDLLFSPEIYLPLNTEVKTIHVIHDLNYEHQKDYIENKLQYKFMKKYSPLYTRKADHIITVSEFSKKDIQDFYQIPASKISVIYNGKSSYFHPLSVQTKENVKSKYSQGEDYFIFVGSQHKRKNIDRLILAFNLFKKSSGSNLKLILVGRMMWRKGKYGRYIQQLITETEYSKDIICLSHLEGKELGLLMGAAKALVFTSLFEGFGIPILEAFECEIPVITSNTSSMPEVAGDAALLCNPKEIEDIAKAMETLIQNEDLQAQLIEKGKIRKEYFSWDKSAKEIWDLFLRQF